MPEYICRVNRAYRRIQLEMDEIENAVKSSDYGNREECYSGYEAMMISAATVALDMSKIIDSKMEKHLIETDELCEV